MHLHLFVNQNSDSLRIDQEYQGRTIKRGESIACPNPTAVIRILHEVFNNLGQGALN